MYEAETIFCASLAEPLNGRRYARFLAEDLSDLLDDVPLAVLNDMWFQQDGAPAHWARDARAVLDRMFPGRWIGRGGPVDWPARSPDLTILDFFVWGYLKEQVYATRPRDRDELKQRIREACARITPEMLRAAQRSFIERVNLCAARQGGHVEHLL